jgi:hypothetical protein
MRTADSAEEDTRLAAARKLFFAHDGSLFYMSRDDQDRRYLEYAVPKSVEQRWLADLTERHLGSLNKPGNWRVINFLLHHRNTNYLDRVVAAPPLGRLWERISYFELLSKYIDVCRGAGASRNSIAASLQSVHEAAQNLVRACQSNVSRERVAKLITETEQRQEELARRAALAAGYQELG